MAFEQRQNNSNSNVVSSDNSSITAQEFSLRAEELGMDPEQDVAFNWIVYKSFADPLPEGWEDGKDEEGNTFFFNMITDVCKATS